jgi:two-component system chemotaxis response regulator CheV
MSQNPAEKAKRSSILLDTGTNEVEFLEIEVSDERFGINVAKVSQLLVWDRTKLTRMPSSDEAFLGAYPFRGSNCSVFDLRILLGMAPAHSDEGRLLLVMEFNERTNGFLVDKVFNIERISWDEFAPLSDSQLDDSTITVIGTIIVDKRVIMILDMEAIMSSVDPSQHVATYANLISAHPTDAHYHRSDVKVLYAEDSGVIRKTTVQTLNRGGFTDVEQFSTGAALLRHVQNHTYGPSTIILSDIEMPELDGLALCKNVKSDPKLQSIPFIFFSSLVNEQMKAKCRSLRADAAFSKPEIHLIVDEIDRLLLERAHAEQAAEAPPAE